MSPPEVSYFPLKGDPGTAFRIICCLVPSEAPRYVSLTPYSHSMTIRIRTLWHSAFFCSGILNKQTNHTDKRVPGSLKHTWKDPCGGGLGPLWHSVDVSGWDRLLALPHTSHSHRKPQGMRTSQLLSGNRYWRSTGRHGLPVPLGSGTWLPFPPTAAARLHHIINNSHLLYLSKHHQHRIRAEAGPSAAFSCIWYWPHKQSKTHFRTASFGDSLRHPQERDVENLLPCYLSHQHSKITSFRKGYRTIFFKSRVSAEHTPH